MTDIETFADITLANLTSNEARFVKDNLPPGEARAHAQKSVRSSDDDVRFMVLVEDLTIAGARDLLTGLAEYRATNILDFPDVPNWRDIRTGTDKAWRDFAEVHNIIHPVGATRERVAMSVRSWLEKNR